MPALLMAPAYVSASAIAVEYPTTVEPAFVRDSEIPEDTETLYTVNPTGGMETWGRIDPGVSILLTMASYYRETLPLTAGLPKGELDFASITKQIMVQRNSEDEESFTFKTLKPLVQRDGPALLYQIDALLRAHLLRPLTRHYFAYMLSYLDGALQDDAMDLLRRYAINDDHWVRTGAEEGLERLELA